MQHMVIKESSMVTEPIVILDIGCRWGFAERFLKPEHLGKFKIYGFDPDQEECARLQAAYAHMPSGAVTCVPQGLAREIGRRNLYITKDPACSSLHPPIQFLAENYPELDCIRLEKIISIDVTTLKKWAQENSIKNIDYIKIDTQGSELEILKGAEEILESVNCIDIEVEFNPIYEGQSLFWEVDAYLRTKGFQLWRFPNIVHYSQDGQPRQLNETNSLIFDSSTKQETIAFGGQVFWADARYVRTSVFSIPAEPTQRTKIINLFNALGMSDVIHSIPNT
ncbi:FkbM family methyltransferase [Vandammella animalimorsus]|uniref:FkbM family methyltransferase n=1 Tax=Vandammella animalimorsus TaxID=2029117 RepID=UPI00325B8F08